MAGNVKRANNHIEALFEDLLGGLVERIFFSHQRHAGVPGFHQHPGEQVVVGVEGRGFLEILRVARARNRKTPPAPAPFPFGEGDVAVLPPEKPHRWITPRGELLALAINLGAPDAPPRRAPRLARDIEVVSASLLGGAAREIYPGLVKDDAELRRLIGQYRTESRVRRPGVRLRAGALALEILVHLARRCVTAGPERDGDRRPAALIERLAPRHYVERARVMLHANYRHPVTLGELAAHVGLSVTHLHRLFVQELKLPPMTYLRQYRLRRAAELLAGAGLSIGEVAREVGFGSAERFSKAFRQYFGRSPRAYRAAALKTGRALL